MKHKVLLLIMYAFLSCLHARNALESVQDIHKNVGSSLLSIRKDYPKSQQQVYTTIDQVSKLCDISKKQHAKRKSFKIAFNEEKKKNDEIMGKVERVAQKIVELQNQVVEKDKKIALLLQHGSSSQVPTTELSVTPPPVSPTQVSFAGEVAVEDAVSIIKERMKKSASMEQQEIAVARSDKEIAK